MVGNETSESLSIAAEQRETRLIRCAVEDQPTKRNLPLLT